MIASLPRVLTHFSFLHSRHRNLLDFDSSIFGSFSRVSTPSFWIPPSRLLSSSSLSQEDKGRGRETTARREEIGVLATGSQTTSHQDDRPTGSMMQDDDWNLLGTPRTELRLEFTLPTGQSFRWVEVGPDAYLGVVSRRAILLRQLEEDVAYRVLARGKGIQDTEAGDLEALADYFNLAVDLTSLSRTWCSADPNYYARLSSRLPGARMLRQDPFECLFSFICSQNNHISRIHGMVNRLCKLYGSPLVLPGKCASESLPEAVYSFPTLEQLCRATEEELRQEGFGYRARYIVGAAQELAEKPEGGIAWLEGLRRVPFEEAVEQLCTLPGVGPKVAACTALFSLDKHSSIPVDTHIWKLAMRYYTPHLRGRSLTPKLHAQVQAAFVAKFGPYAGWAHNTLFIAELASIKAKLRESAAEGGSTSDEEESFGASSSEEENACQSSTDERNNGGAHGGRETSHSQDLNNMDNCNESSSPFTPEKSEDRGSKRKRRNKPERYGKFARS